MIIIYIVAIIKRIWGDIGVGAKDIGKYQNTMSKIDEIPMLHLWSAMLTLSYFYLAYLFISSMYAPETTSAIILWGNVTRLWICLLLERGNILFPKGPFGLIVGQVTAFQLSFLISKKKKKTMMQSHRFKSGAVFWNALWTCSLNFFWSRHQVLYSIFLLGRLMVLLSVSFLGLPNFFLSNLDMCQFFLFRSNYLIIWDYLVC